MLVSSVQVTEWEDAEDEAHSADSGEATWRVSSAQSLANPQYSFCTHPGRPLRGQLSCKLVNSTTHPVVVRGLSVEHWHSYDPPEQRQVYTVPIRLLLAPGDFSPAEVSDSSKVLSESEGHAAYAHILVAHARSSTPH